MARTTPFSVLLIASFALTLTILASQARAQNTTKAECEPLHDLYKTWVSTCTNNGTSIPTSDADPAWTPCICKNGFYPLAVANEECANAGTGKATQITTASLDALCVNATGYVPAASQTSSSDLAPALASATAIASAEATSGATTANASTSAAGMVIPFSQSFMVTVASFTAMVLATAAAL
ncbi:hypothetical protein BGX21_005442 [Mortierella sp. AD011]|nr:hypothetical protein BGX20_001977 [Mortierella sp. AD010]KAF9399880.1 hypothetical protein BGX21_005442 [Mortierella sp. AD011]